ncbi:hypothetical protein VNO77_28929 [Canavalia gladiata]|uniref:NAC domain-containing protein n=1 Tax=Canavalia gladiata TaxID=3824 RepID=A0AAN9KYU5_CANGL
MDRAYKVPETKEAAKKLGMFFLWSYMINNELREKQRELEIERFGSNLKLRSIMNGKPQCGVNAWELKKLDDGGMIEMLLGFEVLTIRTKHLHGTRAIYNVDNTLLSYLKPAKLVSSALFDSLWSLLCQEQSKYSLMEGDQHASNNYSFPPGFRFHPSDEELIVHYLQNKISSRPLPASIIAEIDLYKYNPWELPNKSLFGEEEWYFFSPRDRKYPNGLRPNRAAASGYWKATGTDKPILSSSGSKRIGVKKALVFYSGRPPKGAKTDWIMNEYRLVDTPTKSSKLKGSMRLDDWVLCRVRHKGYSSKNLYENQENPGELNMPANITRSEECPTNTNLQADMITDYQYKDYQIIASILVGGPIPPTENLSNLSFKGCKSNNLASVYEDGFNKVNSQTIPSLDSYFNSLTRKSNEDDRYENLISFNRKFNTENKMNESPSKVLTNRELNCYSQNQSQDDIFNGNPPDPSINFRDLNELTFTGRYPQ